MSLRHGLTPRVKPVGPRKSSVVSVLDIGTNKVVCLVARLDPMEANASLRGRTHMGQILGIGHQRSQGLKAGVINDLELAEETIRQTVHAAERMAKVQVKSSIVNISGGRLSSEALEGRADTRGRPVSDADVRVALARASANASRPSRAVMHALPTSFALDDVNGVRDPRGMVGETLGVGMTVVSADVTSVRNLMLAVERCHIEVEGVVASPFACGLSTLVDDEAEMGAVVVDLGAGTTTIGVFAGGRLVHADGVAVGGNHVTLDVARGLSTRLSAAERLKTLYGSTIATASDDRETIAVPSVESQEMTEEAHIPRAQLVRIIKPRVEEILELVRDRLRKSGLAPEGRRYVLTGGASQLTGLADTASRILSKQVRIGRPLGVKGLPEAAKGPAFATAIGLLIYPQIADVEHFEPRGESGMLAAGGDGYFARVGRWIKESF
ncbi:MAG: cell division protein FtsA [Beijerinckiaceae bacterium]